MFFAGPLSPVMLGMLAAIVLVLAWHVIQAVGIVRALLLEPRIPPHRPLLIAWVVSFASAYLGPFCFVGSILSLVIIRSSKAKQCPETPANRIAIKTAVLANVAMLLAMVSVVTGGLVYIHGHLPDGAPASTRAEASAGCQSSSGGREVPPR
jgi:hypothetical protein